MKKILAFILAILMISTCFISCDMDDDDDKSSNWIDSLLKAGTESESVASTENNFGGNNYGGNNYGGNNYGNNNYWNGSEYSSGTNKTTIKSTNEYGEEKFESVVVPDSSFFGGDTLYILCRNSRNATKEWYSEITEDEVDEVVAMRNEHVTDALNVNVSYIPIASSNYDDCLDKFTKAIADDVNGGTHNYDIIANYAYAGANASVRDYIANMNDKNIFPYFDFSLPCWNQSMVHSTKINNKLYYITGDINLSTFNSTMVVYLNKDVYNRKKSSYDPADLQDLAIEGDGKEGGFTFYELYSWASRANSVQELNGEDGYQHDDFHAISAGFNSIPLDALPYAWDLEYVTTNADGSHKYNIIGNNKIERAIEKARMLFDGSISQGVCNDDNTGWCYLGGYSEPITHFARDRSIFTLHLLYSSEDDNTMLRTMNSEYGLLPIPKYDEDQIDYGTTAHQSYTLITVIDHSRSDVPTKGELVSAYLQYSTEESYTNVRGYYINRIVKPKYFGADDTNGSVTKSIKIFNIISSNIEFDFLSVYAPQLNGVLNTCWRNAVIEGMTAKDAYEADQATFDYCIENLDSWLDIKK